MTIKDKDKEGDKKGKTFCKWPWGPQRTMGKAFPSRVE